MLLWSIAQQITVIHFAAAGHHCKKLAKESQDNVMKLDRSHCCNKQRREAACGYCSGRDWVLMLMLCQEFQAGNALAHPKTKHKGTIFHLEKDLVNVFWQLVRNKISTQWFFHLLHCYDSPFSSNLSIYLDAEILTWANLMVLWLINFNINPFSSVKKVGLLIHSSTHFFRCSFSEIEPLPLWKPVCHLLNNKSSF